MIAGTLGGVSEGEQGIGFLGDRRLEAMCDVFNCEPGELLEREKKGRK